MLCALPIRLPTRWWLCSCYQDDGLVLHSYMITVFIPLSFLATFNFPFPWVISFFTFEICTLSLNPEYLELCFLVVVLYTCHYSISLKWSQMFQKLNMFSNLFDKILDIRKKSIKGVKPLRCDLRCYYPFIAFSCDKHCKIAKALNSSYKSLLIMWYSNIHT